MMTTFHTNLFAGSSCRDRATASKMSSARTNDIAYIAALPKRLRTSQLNRRLRPDMQKSSSSETISVGARAALSRFGHRLTSLIRIAALLC